MSVSLLWSLPEDLRWDRDDRKDCVRRDMLRAKRPVWELLRDIHESIVVFVTNLEGGL